MHNELILDDAYINCTNVVSSAPTFKIALMQRMKIEKEMFIVKLLAIDDIIHLWRNMRLDLNMILEKDEVTDELGKSIMYFFFNNCTEATIQQV